MPYVRKGKCVYKKSGKKKGCSTSAKKAKAYMKALYANENLSFDVLCEIAIEKTNDRA